MKVLVIGGTRFVGRHAVEVLLAEGHDVVVLNRGLSPAPLPATVERIHADRTVPGAVTAVVRGRNFDAVIDCIGYRPKEVEECISAFDGRTGRYVFISTVAVYRPADFFPIYEDAPLNLGSKWAYATGKIACESALLAANARSGFPAVILRPANIYGRYNVNAEEWEFRFFLRLELGRPILVPGDGAFIFHHGHAQDLARAALAAIASPAAPGKTYNITGAQGCTANAYVHAIATACGRSPDIVHVAGVTDRSTAQRFFPHQVTPTQVYSIERAKHDLAWQPRLDLVAGHADAYEWYLQSGFRDRPRDFSVDDEILRQLGR